MMGGMEGHGRTWSAATTAVALLAGGGLICLLGVAFPFSPLAPEGLIAGTGAVSLVLAVGVWVARRRIPDAALHAIVVVVVLMTAVIVAQAKTYAGAMVAAFPFVWIALYVALFFSRRIAFAHADAHQRQLRDRARRQRAARRAHGLADRLDHGRRVSPCPELGQHAAAPPGGVPAGGGDQRRRGGHHPHPRRAAARSSTRAPRACSGTGPRSSKDAGSLGSSSAASSAGPVGPGRRRGIPAQGRHELPRDLQQHADAPGGRRQRRDRAHVHRHHRAPRGREHEGRVRLGRRPRAAHAADLDPRLARADGRRRRSASSTTRASGCSRSRSPTPTGWCG